MPPARKRHRRQAAVTAFFAAVPARHPPAPKSPPAAAPSPPATPSPPTPPSSSGSLSVPSASVPSAPLSSAPGSSAPVSPAPVSPAPAPSAPVSSVPASPSSVPASSRPHSPNPEALASPTLQQPPTPPVVNQPEAAAPKQTHPQSDRLAGPRSNLPSTLPVDPPPRFAICTSLASCDIPPVPAQRQLGFHAPFAELDLPPRRPAPSTALLSTPITPQGNSGERTCQPDDAAPTEPYLRGDEQPSSRLSRRRNLVRRAAAAAAAAEEAAVPECSSDGSSSLIVKRVSRKRPRASSTADDPARPHGKEKPRQLHPFFAAAAASAATTKEARQKRSRVAKPTSDAWSCVGATQHVNFAPPLLPWVGSACGPGPGRDVGGVEKAFPYYLSMGGDTVSDGGHPRRTELQPHEGGDGRAWAEKYKLDKRTDVISASVMKELVDWLRPWYTDSESTSPCSGSDSDVDSCVASFLEQDPCDMERIALITGPVGCGKSTVVTNAARQLGLTVLEVNASVCRNGKKVREVVREALRTHRVAAGNTTFADGVRVKMEEQGKNASSGAAAKSMILFEEVDELQEDERGFWQSLQELATSSECRRPIVCTANSFNWEMRQMFVEPKEVARTDLDRLFVKVREEPVALNPMAYKHIYFPNRSERQATAVLKRVVSGEMAALPTAIVDCVAQLHIRDSRKAINLLQFWNSRGLSSLEADFVPITVTNSHMSPSSPEVTQTVNQGLTMINGVAGQDTVATIFEVGADNFVGATPNSPRKPQRTSPRSLRRKRPPEKQDGGSRSNIASPDVLSKWSESLELMSYADTMVNSAVQRDVYWSVDDFEDDEQHYCGEQHFYDDNFQRSQEVAKDLNALSVWHSRKYLSLRQDDGVLSQIAKRVRGSLGCTYGDLRAGNVVPRRPLYSEYLPILRIMAQRSKSGSGGEAGQGNGSLARIPRRTRASKRKGGFCSLDLDPYTVQSLKHTCLSPQQ